MTIINSLSNCDAQHVGEIQDLGEIRKFIIGNGDELIRVANAAGGHNARAAATELVDTVLSGSAPADLVFDILITVRDLLRDGSLSGRGPSGHGRGDLDAAIRWHGARLDELSRRSDCGMPPAH